MECFEVLLILLKQLHIWVDEQYADVFAPCWLVLMDCFFIIKKTSVKYSHECFRLTECVLTFPLHVSLITFSDISEALGRAAAVLIRYFLPCHLTTSASFCFTLNAKSWWNNMTAQTTHELDLDMAQTMKKAMSWVLFPSWKYNCYFLKRLCWQELPKISDCVPINPIQHCLLNSTFIGVPRTAT